MPGWLERAVALVRRSRLLPAGLAFAIGFACLSLTLDDREDTKAVADAEAFLKSQGATFTNVLLDEEFGIEHTTLQVDHRGDVLPTSALGRRIHPHPGHHQE